jgi:hypothetical protein
LPALSVLDFGLAHALADEPARVGLPEGRRRRRFIDTGALRWIVESKLRNPSAIRLGIFR